MDPAVVAILLLMFGLALLAAEVFIPSAGLLSVASILCLGGSVWYAWSAWYSTSPMKWWSYIATLVVLLPTVVSSAFYLFPRTSLGRKFLLEGPDLDEVSPYAAEQQRLAAMIGRTGPTLSLLNPGGLVSVDGERMHCESEGVIVESGVRVEIIGVKGNRVVVRESREDASDRVEREADGDELERPPLDFDISQG